MSKTQLPSGATVHPRHLESRRPSVVRERVTIASRYAPSARELAAALRIMLHESRPRIVTGDRRRRDARFVLGAPTFRNVIENGEHK